MDNYIKLRTNASSPKVEWFENLPLPEGRTYKVTHREVRDLLSIIATDENGQERNEVRATGTDNNNKNALKSSIVSRGVKIDSQPPFIFADGRLTDGWTRFSALQETAFTRWIFNIVAVKEGFTEDDVRDEIGLGQNDHPPSKAATPDDFKKRLARWASLQKEVPSLGDCISWVNNIPHSFTQQQVINIADSVVTSQLASKSMEHYDAPKAKKFAGRVLPKNVVPIAMNCNGNSTYYRRAALEALELHAAGRDHAIVGFLQNIIAEDADEARQVAIEKMEYYNECFEKAFEARFRDSNFKMFNLEGFVPQILDVEDSEELIR